MVLHHANTRLWCLHAATSLHHSSAVIDELDAWITPDWLPLMKGEAGSFLSTLDVLEFDSRRLLLQVSIDANHLAEVAEESVDFDIIKLLLRHILNID